MILPDWKIRQLCEEQRLVEPLDSDRVNPASMDLCIGDEVVDLTNNHRLRNLDTIRIVPGGQTSYGNLRLACASCNQQKAAK